MSASAHNARVSLMTCAPAARYASSSNDARSPASASTFTAKPSFNNWPTVSGVAATRRSPARISRGTAMIIAISGPVRQSVRQHANSFDGHPDRRTVLDRTDAYRCAARDHIAGHQRHVLRNQAYLFRWRKDHVRERVVLPFDVIEPRHDVSVAPVEIALDRGSNATEGIEALCAAPLREVGIFIQQFARRHVVDAAIAEDVIVRLVNRYIAAALADHDRELAFVRDLAAVRFGALDGFAMTNHRCGRLDQKERMRRRGLAEFLGERAKVVPERDDFCRDAWTEQRNVVQTQHLRAWCRLAEHVAVILGDASVLQNAETRLAVRISKAYPRFHQCLLQVFVGCADAGHEGSRRCIFSREPRRSLNGADGTQMRDLIRLVAVV